MKIGIEEEFIVVDPETLFCTPGAFRLANGLVYRNSEYVRKCSVELPLHSGPLRNIVKNLRKCFSVFEIKTDPYEDIERLKDELVFHRKNLADVAIENHLWVLPTGLHPLYSSEVFLPDNCAALHVHVDYQKEVFACLYEKIPFLISLSGNSPLYNGKPGVFSTRLNTSPHISIPSEVYRRSSDIIHNRHFNTVEVRVLDSQITVSDSIGLACIIKAIAEQDGGCKELYTNDYPVKRQKAITEGTTDGLIAPDKFERILHYNEYTRRFLNERTGAEWQLMIYNKHGLSSVIASLWESFCADRRVVKPSNHPISSKNVSLSNLFYLIPYFPFFVIDKYKKYHQDIESIGKLFFSLAK